MINELANVAKFLIPIIIIIIILLIRITIIKLMNFVRPTFLMNQSALGCQRDGQRMKNILP